MDITNYIQEVADTITNKTQSKSVSNVDIGTALTDLATLTKSNVEGIPGLTGLTSFYQTLQFTGTSIQQRGKLNFLNGFTYSDNFDNDSTDITLNLGGLSGVTTFSGLTNKPTTLLGYGISSADTLFNNKYYPYTSNPAGYLLGITSLNVTNALGYTPFNGVFSGLTGKPTTLAGYGINSGDSIFNGRFYPLASNPLNFLIGITGQQVIDALGYTPASNGVSGATLISPAFSGTPTAPTAVSGTNTTQIATTAFVQTAISTISGITGSAVTVFSGLTNIPNTLSGYTVSSADTLFDNKYYLSTNPKNFITGITSTNVITALGYIPSSGGTGGSGVTTFSGLTGIPNTLSGYSITSGDTLFNNKFQSIGNYVSASTLTNYFTSGQTDNRYINLTGTTGITNFGGLNINNTDGTGVLLLNNQITRPVTPATGITKVYHSSSGLTWITSSGFQRSFSGSGLTADTVYILPINSGTLQLNQTTLSGYSISSADTLFSGRFYPLTGNPSSYLTTITSGNVITALGYTPSQSGVSGATLNSPAFSGTPTAPTAASGTSTTQIATTAFVQQELGNSSVTFAPGVFIGSGTTGIPYTLNLDNYPTSGNTIPVSSDGVFQAINAIAPSAVDEGIVAMQAFGSVIKGYSLGGPFMQQGANITLSSGASYFVALFLPKAATLNGLKFSIQTTGNFTSTGYNGVGLYSVSGGTLTLVASSATSSTMWKNPFAFNSVAFTSTYSANAGAYYAALTYNNSGTTTDPKLYGSTTTTGVNLYDFTNGNKTAGILNGATLPATVAASAITASSSAPYIMMY